MKQYVPFFTRCLTLCLALALSQTALSFPARAQNAPLSDDATARSSSPHYAALVQLREDWARRDPTLKGPAQLDQQQNLQRRAIALGQAYENWLQSNPQSINGWLELAEIHFVFLNRFDTAETYLNQALTRAPEHIQANIAQAEFDFFFKKDTKAALGRLENNLQIEST